MDDDLKHLWMETDHRLASMEPVLRLNVAAGAGRDAATVHGRG